MPASPDLSQKQQNAHHLASGYGMGKRSMETGSIFFFIVFWTSVSLKLFSAILANDASILTIVGVTIFGSLLGMLVADFASGMVHWACDTWGSVDKGAFKAFIRSFREHHVDPLAITRHDFIEANGDNCMAVVPVLLILQYLWYGKGLLSIFVMSFGLWVSLWVSLTNQIHKWAHTEKAQLPAYVIWLQEHRIILSRRAHKTHHMSPYDTDYCITTGWLNTPLTSAGYWKWLESVVTKYTGNIPRIDDANWTLETEARSEPTTTMTPSSSSSKLADSNENLSSVS